MSLGKTFKTQNSYYYMKIKVSNKVSRKLSIIARTCFDLVKSLVKVELKGS